jgi:hypothetical protein
MVFLKRSSQINTLQRSVEHQCSAKEAPKQPPQSLSRNSMRGSRNRNSSITLLGILWYRGAICNNGFGSLCFS